MGEAPGHANRDHPGGVVVWPVVGLDGMCGEAGSGVGAGPYCGGVAG